MSATKITTKAPYAVNQSIASVTSDLNSQNGNQSETYIFVDITVDGSGTTGQIIFNSTLQGVATGSSVIMKSRSGGGINFLNSSNKLIASLDSLGNFKTIGSITQNTKP